MPIKHKHHIMPKHLGGTNDPDNLVEVSVEEHARIHHSQWILGGRWQDKMAWQTLTGIVDRKDAIKEIQSRYGRRPKTESWRQKISESMKGRKQTAESNKKRSEKLLGRIWDNVRCPRCKFIGKGAVMKRWHFDNCRG